MKTNTLPALIIAAAIIFSAVFSHWASSRAVESFFADLEQSVLEKNGDGKTRLTELVAGAVSSVSDGFRSGLSDSPHTSDNSDTQKAEARDRLTIREIRIVRGNHDSEERVIGIIRNDGAGPLKHVSARVTYRDAQGALLDVDGRATLIDGPLKSGEEIAFEITRSLGEFDEPKVILQSRKATTALVTVSDVVLAEKPSEATQPTKSGGDQPEDASKVSSIDETH